MTNLGHNRPPEGEAIRLRLQEEYKSLLERAKELETGFGNTPTVIEDEGMAMAVSDFVVQINSNLKNLEKARTHEKEFFLRGGREVDGFFKTAAKAINDAKAELARRLTVYHRAKEAEERRAREEEARKAAAEAERLRKEAEARAAALAKEDELDSAIEAEKAAAEAAKRQEEARRAAAAKASELSRTRGDYGAVSSLKTFWTFSDLDRQTLDLEALRPHIPLDALERAVRSYIKAAGDSEPKKLTGVHIFQDSKTVTR